MSGLYLVCIQCMYKPTFLKQYMKILGVATTTRHPNQTLDSNLFTKTSYPMARPNGSRQPECVAVPRTISSGSVSVLLRNIWNKYWTLQWCKFSPHISLHVLLDRRLGQLSPPFLLLLRLMFAAGCQSFVTIPSYTHEPAIFRIISLFHTLDTEICPLTMA